MPVCACVEDPGCEAPVTKILAAGADHNVFLQWNLPVHRRCQVDPSTLRSHFYVILSDRQRRHKIPG